MAAAMRIALLAAAAMAVLISTASAATTYTVGQPAGDWTLGIDYGTWVSDKKFLTGDSIVFKYSPQAHDVLEVSKADYDSCTATGPITTSKTGDDTVLLSAAGTRYFICGVGTHCNNGMKVTIDVTAGSSPSPPAPANGPSASNSPPPSPPAPAKGPSASKSPPPSPHVPASGPGASNSPSSPSSAATSVGASAGLGLVVLLAALMA